MAEESTTTWSGQGWDTSKRSSDENESPVSPTERLDDAGTKLAEKVRDLEKQLGEQEAMVRTFDSPVQERTARVEELSKAQAELKAAINVTSRDLEKARGNLASKGESMAAAEAAHTEQLETMDKRFNRLDKMLQLRAQAIDLEVNPGAHISENEQFKKGRTRKWLEKQWKGFFLKNQEARQSDLSESEIVEMQNSFDQRLEDEVVRALLTEGYASSDGEARKMYNEFNEWRKDKNNFTGTAKDRLKELNAELDKELAERQRIAKEIDHADEEVKRVQDKIAGYQAEAKSLGEELSEAEKLQESVQGEHRGAVDQAEKLKKSLADAREALSAKEKEYKAYLADVGKQLISEGMNYLNDDSDPKHVREWKIKQVVVEVAAPGSKDLEVIADKLGKTLRLARIGKPDGSLVEETHPAFDGTRSIKHSDLELRLSDERTPEGALAELRLVTGGVIERAMRALEAGSALASKREELIKKKRTELEEESERDLDAFITLESTKLHLLTAEQYNARLAELNIDNDPQIAAYREKLQREKDEKSLLESNSKLAILSGANIARLSNAIVKAEGNLEESETRKRLEIKALEEKYEESQQKFDSLRKTQSMFLAGEVTRKLGEYVEILKSSTDGLEGFTRDERELILSMRVSDQLFEAEFALSEVIKWESVIGLSMDGEARARALEYISPLAKETVRHRLAVEKMQQTLDKMKTEKEVFDSKYSDLDSRRVAFGIGEAEKAQLDISAGQAKNSSLGLGKQITEIEKDLANENKQYPDKILKLQKALLPADLLKVDGVAVGIGGTPKTNLGKLAELILYGGTFARVEADGMRRNHEQNSIFKDFGGLKTLDSALTDLETTTREQEVASREKKEKRKQESDWVDEVIAKAEEGLDAAVEMMTTAETAMIAENMRRMEPETAMLFIKRLGGSGKLQEKLSELADLTTRTPERDREYRNLLTALDVVGDILTRSEDPKIKGFMGEEKGLGRFFNNVKYDLIHLE